MWKMKRILLSILLIISVVAALCLLTGFLPQQWQENMYSRLNTFGHSQSYDYSRITHPNLDHELQPFKPLSLGLLAGMVVINGTVIVALWTRRKHS
jgi:hypothetical protein